MPSILIIEDEKPIAELLTYGLTQQGYDVRAAYTGGEGMAALAQKLPDMLLLDWMLPDCSGVDLCRMITEQYNIPIIMLTARNRMDDKVHGLEAGADDYITKPFELREVAVRIKAVLRRLHKATQPGEDELVRMGDILINPVEMTVTRQGKAVDLTPKEFDLLLYFVRHPGRVLTRDILLEQVWGYDFAGDTRTVDTHIQRVRKKVAAPIQTGFGVGYKYAPQK